MFVFCHYIVWIIMKGTHFTIRDEIVFMSNCIGCKFTSLKESVNYLFKHVTLTTYILVQCSHMYWVLVICTSITIVIFIHKCAKRILFKSVLCIPMCRLKHWNITEGCEHVCRLYLSVSPIKVTFLLNQVFFLICSEYFLCLTNFLWKKNQPESDTYLIKLYWIWSCTPWPKFSTHSTHRMIPYSSKRYIKICNCIVCNMHVYFLSFFIESEGVDYVMVYVHV